MAARELLAYSRSSRASYPSHSTSVSSACAERLCAPADSQQRARFTLTRSGTGRTLPHCYVEIKSLQVANDVIIAMDRKLLGDRTVRLKWERRGELMRDVSLPRQRVSSLLTETSGWVEQLFSQEAYFSVPAATPAAAPLPPVPMRYTLPQNIVTEKDLDLLLSYCRTAVSSRR